MSDDTCNPNNSISYIPDFSGLIKHLQELRGQLEQANRNTTDSARWFSVEDAAAILGAETINFMRNS